VRCVPCARSSPLRPWKYASARPYHASGTNESVLVSPSYSAIALLNDTIDSAARPAEPADIPCTK
jgi:hypothetical protein